MVAKEDIVGSGADVLPELSSFDILYIKLGSLFYPLVVLSLFLIILILAWFVARRAVTDISRGIPTVLLIGPTGAGKTALFSLWHDPEDAKETVTSISSNVAANFAFNPKYRLVDCPGHEKLVHNFRTYAAESDLKAIVFVVDAASGVESIENAAKLLMLVLETAEQKERPVLIAANKSDLFSSLSTTKVTKILETEIDKLRALKTKSVQSSEGDESWDAVEFLGIDGKKFEFNDLISKVAVLDGSVKTNKLSKWESWLEDQLNGA